MRRVSPASACSGGSPAPSGTPKNRSSAITVAWPTTTCTFDLDATVPAQARSTSRAGHWAARINLSLMVSGWTRL